jgi:hypothetical protein
LMLNLDNFLPHTHRHLHKERKKIKIAFNTELINTILPSRLICLFRQESNRFLRSSKRGSHVKGLFALAPIGRPRYLNGKASQVYNWGKYKSNIITYSISVGVAPVCPNLFLLIFILIETDFETLSHLHIHWFCLAENETQCVRFAEDEF